MNQTPRPLDDDALLDRLADLLDRDEPVPDDAVEAAYAAFDFAFPDDELAALVYDSLVADGAVTMRGIEMTQEAETRLLTFANDRLTLDVELLGDGYTIVGQMTPVDVSHSAFRLENENGKTVGVHADHLGRFRISLIGGGAFRFRVPGLLVTPWISR